MNYQNALKYGIRLNLYLMELHLIKISSKPTYNNKHIKTKISSYNENFHDKKRLTKYMDIPYY